MDVNTGNEQSITIQANWVAHVYNFDYTGNEQTFTAPWSGYYKLEVWGASGGNANSSVAVRRGGYGGYAVGVVSQTKNSTLYIQVGGGGAHITNLCVVTNVGYGYNGGGTWSCQGHYVYGDNNTASWLWGSGAGGATHIASVSGLLKNLSSYKDTGGTNVSKEILIVAGGGGAATNADSVYGVNGSGGNHTAIGGNGGGVQGVKGDAAPVSTNYAGGTPGTQTSPGGTPSYGSYASNTYNIYPGFGQGCSAFNDNKQVAALRMSGGGGWYGGGCHVHSGGGGGSGYIGSSNLISGAGITKHMTCYSCTTSTAAATRTNSNTNVSSTATADYSKTGNGYARITYLGSSI